VNKGNGRLKLKENKIIQKRRLKRKKKYGYWKAKRYQSW